MTPYWTNGIATLYQSDARALPLPDKSVHCCVTSPPYWGLRDYGVEGGIGLESTVGEWVQAMVEVGREVHRVLRDDGTWWLNLGDSYWGGKGASNNVSAHYDERDTETLNQRHHNINQRGATRPSDRRDQGFQPKTLLGQPWRVAFALQDDGWILRSAIVWHKPNPMPESVRDRPTNAYEMVFLLSKQGRYFYDAEAIRVPAAKPWLRDFEYAGKSVELQKQGGKGRNGAYDRTQSTADESTANARNVWSIPTQGRPDAHFATFPDELPRRCILSGTSAKGVCADCGAPWVRVVEKESEQPKGNEQFKAQNTSRNDGDRWHGTGLPKTTTQTLGWQPTCGCNADTVPATVLDPFAGSGTTLAVAQELGKWGIGTDLNPEYLDLARGRINKTNGITLPMMV